MNGNNCDALLYRVENVTFEAFTPRIPIDFIDGVEMIKSIRLRVF